MTKNGIKESWQKSTWIKQKKPLEKQETADAGILGKVLEEFSRSSSMKEMDTQCFRLGPFFNLSKAPPRV